MESPFPHQLRLQSVLPRDIIHVTILMLSITRAPAVNLTDVCTGTLVSKCKISYYVHLFRLDVDIFLNDSVHFTLETKFEGSFFKKQLNVSRFAFFQADRVSLLLKRPDRQLKSSFAAFAGRVSATLY